MGVEQTAELVLLGVRLNFFGRVSDNLITASANCTFGDVEHCVSFDFAPALLPAIVAGLPQPLRGMFTDALNRAPFQAAAGLVIELDISAKLGELIRVRNEEFVPILIQEIRDSRFNPEPVPNDPKDIPAHVFQLRNAFTLGVKSDNI